MTDPVDVFGDEDDNLALESAPLIKTRVRKVAAAAPAVERRTRIVLEDNEQIPPTGQFIGADGKGFMIRPGEPVDVPDSVLNVLDTAVASTPITDANGTVLGYRDRLRFPYRIWSERRSG